MDIIPINNNLLHSLWLFAGAVGIYKFFNIDDHIDVRITSRVVSIFICSTILYDATWCLWYDDFTVVWNNVVVIGKFYTLLDAYFIIFNYAKFSSMYWKIILHHIILFYIFLNHQINVRLLAIGLFVESSTIMLNIGWFMIKAGWEKTLLFKINSGLIWITYLIFRVIMLPIILCIADVTFWTKVIIFPLVLLNWYWFSMLTGKFLQLLRGDQLKVE